MMAPTRHVWVWFPKQADQRERERQALAPLHPITPYGTSNPLRAPKAPGDNRPAGPAAKKGGIGVQRGQKGPGPLSDRLAQQAWR
jgi:hypothetical protein